MTTTHTIHHLSDLHIGLDPSRRLRTDAIVRHITSTCDPAHTTVCVTGDVTEGVLELWRRREHRAQMIDARHALQPLLDSGFDVCVVPGNHDTYLTTGATFADERERGWFHKEIMAPLMPWASGPGPWFRQVAPGVHLALLDSTEGQRGPDFDAARGCNGARQLSELDAWCEGVRAAEPGAVIIVAQHHNTEYDKWSNRLEDEAELLAILTRHGVDVLLEGHEHVERTTTTATGLIKLASRRSTDLWHGDRLQWRALEIAPNGAVTVTQHVTSE